MFLAPKDGAISRLLQRYPRDDVDLMGRSMEQARNVVAPVRATEPPNLHSRRRAEAGSEVERQLVAVEADGQHLTEQIKQTVQQASTTTTLSSKPRCNARGP